jgi:hypothetical protein
MTETGVATFRRARRSPDHAGTTTWHNLTRKKRGFGPSVDLDRLARMLLVAGMVRRADCLRLTLPLTLVLACGGGTTSSGGDHGGRSGAAGSSAGGSDAGGSSAGGSSAGGSSAGGSGGSGAACPERVPAPGSSCKASDTGSSFASAQCSWGDDRRPQCRTTARCTDGSWSVMQPPAACTDTVPLPAACPATPGAAKGSCDDPTLACWYDDSTICRCMPCVGGSEYPICQPIDPPEWFCKQSDSACPNPMPQAGSSCDKSSELNCGPSCELPIRCRDGVWQYEQEACPICAAPDTPIATPQGERPIAQLAPGDLVYSVEGNGIVVVPILRVGSTPVQDHRVIRVELESGSVLEISPGHPTADGRKFADLVAGDRLDRDAVLSAEVATYTYARTYDILPGSSTGTYFAGGALIGSTLVRDPRTWSSNR